MSLSFKTLKMVGNINVSYSKNSTKKSSASFNQLKLLAGSKFHPIADD